MKLARITPCCIWLTGLSGSGKSTLAHLLLDHLHCVNQPSAILDGDELRNGLNCDLGFSEADRIENMRRGAEVARLMVDAGIVVIVALISPLARGRELARARFRPGQFIEVFVDAPLEECERRDPKGLYLKARRGEIPQFTGIDSPFEVPTRPEIHLRTAVMDPAACIEILVRHINA